MRSRIAIVVCCLLLVVAACAGDDDEAAPTTTLPATTPTAQPTSTTVAPTTPPTTAPTTAPPTTTTTEPPPDAVASLPAGLFCRDLEPQGFTYAEAVAYWILEGRPDRMDADRNGIPCETVYPPEDVAAYWAGQPPVVQVALPAVPRITEGTWGGPDWPESLSGVSFADAVPTHLREMLRNEGFVIDDTTPSAHVAWLYEGVYPYGDRPVFVTTDAAFHVWHLVFDKILRDTESEVLLPVLEEFVAELLADARRQASNLGGSPLADAAARAAEHLEAVATVLELDVGAIGSRAEAEVALVDEHTQFGVSPTVGGNCPPSCVDYTKMKPRGHYTRSPELTRFFKAMSLLGNVAFGVGDADALQVGLLLSRLVTTDPDLTTAWARIYQPTAVLVGAADDYTPFEAQQAAASVTPGGLTDPLALDLATVRAIGDALADLRPVRINPEYASLRTMGVRFIIDSYIYDQLVYPSVGERTRVSPLDLAAALGSEWSLDRLEATDPWATTDPYVSTMTELRTMMAERTMHDWGATVYDAWLYALEPTVLPYGDAFPPFMQRDAWRAKSHQTGFGSYTELKHDTILYGKEGMAEGDEPLPEAEVLHWVEPDPVTFERIANTARLMRDVLDGQGLLPADGDTFGSLRGTLEETIDLIDRFSAIASTELTAGRPTQADSDWLESIGGRFESLLWLTGHEGDIDPFGALVADIFLDAGSEPFTVLELGTGEFDRIHVIVPNASGGFEVATGAVYSYYEFWQPSSDRLTDEQWWEMIRTDTLPGRPDWVHDYLRP